MGPLPSESALHAIYFALASRGWLHGGRFAPPDLPGCVAPGRFASGVHDACAADTTGATSLRGISSRPRAPSRSMPRARRGVRVHLSASLAPSRAGSPTPTGRARSWLPGAHATIQSSRSVASGLFSSVFHDAWSARVAMATSLWWLCVAPVFAVLRTTGEPGRVVSVACASRLRPCVEPARLCMCIPDGSGC